uniref:Neur_chan_LBD domain-containing protein n=1 Tax=Caenorhabditis tropicalis TaxID=1561998 RepID=A0A1I7UP12_9PELO
MLPYVILTILIRLSNPSKVLEKYGKQVQLSPPTTSSYQEWFDSNRVHSTRNNTSIEDFRTQLRRSLGQFINDQRRLVEELLDPNYYEKTVHPRRDYTRPTRVNLSMSLYQILDVDEHMQSIEVNVWMVQHWYDEFLDWNPVDYGMINRTIVPYHQIWIPDTYLYNSEELEQKKTESLMNAQLETGHWNQKKTGAKVQLMFPAIYKLSCRMDAKMKALRKNQYRMSMDTSQARSVKKQKMQRRCSLEWEFLANVLDRILLTVFCGFTFAVFVILVGFDSLFTVHTKAKTV